MQNKYNTKKFLKKYAEIAVVITLILAEMRWRLAQWFESMMFNDVRHH